MALFHRKQKNGQNFIVVFDIGSGSIGGAFVSINKGENPEVIFGIRYDIPFQEKLNYQRFIELMTKTLENVFEAMQKAGGGVAVSKAFCILASPWYASQTRLIHYGQPTPFIVNEKGLAKLIQKEIESFRNSNFFTGVDLGKALPEIMESKNIQMKLNGYKTRSPFGKTAGELEVALYISMIPFNIFESINRAIMKFWGVTNVHFSSFSLTAFDTIRDIFSDESDFIFMDISAEVTDISLIKDNVLIESISFPAGKNILIRSLVKKLKTIPAAAISELNLYLENRTTHEHAKQIEEAITAASRDWGVFFDDALNQFASEYPIPQTIFYTADDNVIKWFNEVIHDTEFRRFSSDEGTFVTRSLGNTFLNKFITVSEPSFQDPFLSIETIFANKFISLTEK